MDEKEITEYMKKENIHGYIENNILRIVIPVYKKIIFPKNKDIVTPEWIQNKIIDKDSFINLSDILNKIQFDSFNVYPASYGLGVALLGGYRQAIIEEIKKVEEYLIKNNIDFKTEFSSKNWVYRFKISKKTDNINKLKELI